MIVGFISCWLSLSGVRGQRGVAAQSTDDLQKHGKIWQASVWLLNKGDKWLSTVFRHMGELRGEAVLCLA
jgi:hypothetical protein